MNKKQKMRLPASVKKHIRKEKARIRRDFLSDETRDDLIKKLYAKFNDYINESEKEKEQKNDKLEKKEIKPKKNIKLKSKTNVKVAA